MGIRRTTMIGSLGAASALALTGCLGVTTDSTVIANGQIMSTTWTMTYDRNQTVTESASDAPDSLQSFEDAVLSEGVDARAAGETLFPREENCTFTETEEAFTATCTFIATAQSPITFNDLQSVLLVQDIQVVLKGEEIGIEMTAAANLDSGTWAEALGFSSTNILRMPGDITLLNGPGITQVDDKTIEWKPFAPDVSQGDVIVIASKTSSSEAANASSGLVIGIASLAVLLFLGSMMFYQRTQPRVRDAEPAGSEFEGYVVYESSDEETPAEEIEREEGASK